VAEFGVDVECALPVAARLLGVAGRVERVIRAELAALDDAAHRP
jgi:UDP-N-acetylmuramyl tripeptide synthase